MRSAVLSGQRINLPQSRHLYAKKTGVLRLVFTLTANEKGIGFSVSTEVILSDCLLPPSAQFSSINSN